MVKNNILRLSGWGRNIRSTCKVVEYSENLNLKDFMKKKLIARGMGRSYGDSSLQPKLTINMSNHNNVIKFDKKKGTISVESGASIGQLLELTVRFGWFMPVSPGTKNVTVGGMVASNVHGKK